MGQFLKMCGLAGAGALLVAATPVLAGHVAGAGFAGHGGIRIVRPGGPVGGRPSRSGTGFPPWLSSRPLRGILRRRQNFFGARGRFGYDFGYAYPRGYYRPGYGSSGFFPGADAAFAWSRQRSKAPAIRPTRSAMATRATGRPAMASSYNVPPPGWAPAKIIYIKGNHVRRETYIRPRQTVIVRGAASVDRHKTFCDSENPGVCRITECWTQLADQFSRRGQTGDVVRLARGDLQPQHQLQVLHGGAGSALAEIVEPRDDHRLAARLIGEDADFQIVGAVQRLRLQLAAVLGARRRARYGWPA